MTSVLTEIEDNYFVPLDVMPTGRLNDVMKSLEDGRPSVINLDACIPPGNINVLRTILYRIEEVKAVKTLSLRFNNLGEEGGKVLIDWIARNDVLEVLYVLGTGIEGPVKAALEEAWRKNMRAHKIENMGYTLIRIPGVQPPPVITTPVKK